MATTTGGAESRKAVLSSQVAPDQVDLLSKALEANNNNLTKALPSLQSTLPAKTLDRLKLADQVVDLAGNNHDVATYILAKSPNATTLGEVARATSLNDLTDMSHFVISQPGKGLQEKASLRS
jgi:hypothetical protein